MGYILSKNRMNDILHDWMSSAVIFAPVRHPGQSEFSGQDCIRYANIQTLDEIEFEEKSSFSFKEAFLPLCETLFFFTEDSVKEADYVAQETIIFLRSCDLHALRRMDEIYLHNGEPDYYYARRRANTRFILMGCSAPFRNCFCVDMNTNRSSDYDAYLKVTPDGVLVDNKLSAWNAAFQLASLEEREVVPDSVTQTAVQVQIPPSVSPEMFRAELWNEYDARCINCGRCNFSCPTCTCFTMQDISYTDNGKAGERRRVHASCVVDGFADVAGGGSYRQVNGQRMRFKVLHKVYDYAKRFGYHMCVGCGRCDDVCPEYISFSHCINRLTAEEARHGK